MSDLDDIASEAISQNPFYGSMRDEDFYEQLSLRQKELLSKDASSFMQKQKLAQELLEQKNSKAYIDQKV